MGRPCSTYGGEVRTGVWRGNLRERGHLEDPGVGVRIILNAELNPICKSQLAELFCGVFKFYACFSKNLNISRNKRDKFVKQKAFCGERNRHCSVCLEML